MGHGFSVDMAKLRAGSHEVTGLQSRCVTIAKDAVDALAGMAGSAGHGGLESALTGAAGQGITTFFLMGAVYQHVGVGLEASSQTYSSTEQAITARAKDIFRGLR
jgi:hypothetical protein